MNRSEGSGLVYLSPVPFSQRTGSLSPLQASRGAHGIVLISDLPAKFAVPHWHFPRDYSHLVTLFLSPRLPSHRNIPLYSPLSPRSLRNASILPDTNHQNSETARRVPFIIPSFISSIALRIKSQMGSVSARPFHNVTPSNLSGSATTQTSLRPSNVLTFS